MKVRTLLNKLFTGGIWIVGIRDKKDQETSYHKLTTEKGQWIADPFLYEEDGKHFLFVEQFFQDKNRAGIAVAELAGGGKLLN